VLACGVSKGCCGGVDRVQQRSRWLGFPFAVMGKFRDDHGGALTTVIAYNAFFALFPEVLQTQ
jgi:membrane protein